MKIISDLVFEQFQAAFCLCDLEALRYLQDLLPGVQLLRVLRREVADPSVVPALPPVRIRGIQGMDNTPSSTIMEEKQSEESSVI